jgi:hypothetical protein
MTWKEKLAGQTPADMEQEIDIYETQLELRKLGKIDEKLFAETRLRRGAYGQRYDNGQRTTVSRRSTCNSRKRNSPRARTQCGTRPVCSGSRFRLAA